MPATGPAPIYLTILRKGDLNIIDLAEVGSLIARGETQVDDAFLQELTTKECSRPGNSVSPVARRCCSSPTPVRQGPRQHGKGAIAMRAKPLALAVLFCWRGSEITTVYPYSTPPGARSRRDSAPAAYGNQYGPPSGVVGIAR
jgi:hypothetical protein